MQAHTKKRPTEVALQFIGPAARAKEAVRAMEALGFQEDGEARPWRDVLGYKQDELPSVFLSGARYREDLTQQELSERTGIPRRHISEMENGKRPIGKQNARKLAEVLNVDPRRFLAV